MKANRVSYNSRLQKGGALLDDMRVLVRAWSDQQSSDQRQKAIESNVLAKRTRARVADTLKRAFLPRFVAGDPPAAWKIVRELEDRDLPLEVIRPVYYWITARTERLLYDFVCEELVCRSKGTDPTIGTDAVASWITQKLTKADKRWSPTVTVKVARGLLAALRDFGILEGGAKKRIAPVYLPFEAFAYVAFVLNSLGSSGQNLVSHPNWKLFLLSETAVEHLFLEADRRKLVRYQAAGKIVRIDFPASNLSEMADVLVARTNQAA